VDVEPIDATLGAVITGVRLACINDDMFRAIEEAFHAYAVLVFPGQHLTQEEQVAFARHFGELERLAGELEAAPLANVSREGEVFGADHPVMAILRGNSGWHTDSSYMPVSAKASALSAHVVHEGAGGTEWADMRAAYHALDDQTKALIEWRSAAHSIRYSQQRAGEHQATGYGFDVDVPPRRPLVKVHPVTGCKALFVGRHAHAVEGMTTGESEALLDRLVDFACRPPRLYTHHWTVGDLVLWDNRCVLHRAEPWAWDRPRVMVHTRIAGDPVTEAAMAL
jgi:alpha-ketoglutarate-dependent taurine dioxygenase